MVASQKAKPAPRRKNQGQTYDPNKGNGPNGRRARPARPGPQAQLQQGGAGMRALFLDGPGSRGGTGVFLPRGGPTTPSESTNKQGNILIWIHNKKSFNNNIIIYIHDSLKAFKICLIF